MDNNNENLTNNDLQAFMRNDWDFKEYLNHRNEDDSDVQNIFDTLKSGNLEDIPEEKEILKKFMQSPNPELQDIIQMGESDDFMRYTATKLITRLYDRLINGKLNEHHKIEQKPKNQRSESEQRKLNQAGFRINVEISKAMKRDNSIKEEMETAIEIRNTCKRASENSNGDQIPFDSLIEIAKDKKSQIHEILKRAGKYQMTFAHKIRTKCDGYEILTGIGFGNEIENLLPEEIMYLDDEDYQDIKNLELLSGNLQEYKFKGYESKTGGPIIALIDESGSMRGNRIIEAKAFCFGLYQKAKAENRDMKIIAFGEREEVVDVKSPTDLVDYATKFRNDCDTRIQPPLTMARQIIEQSPKSSKADIIIITDGACDIYPDFEKDFKDFKDKSSTKVICMQIATRLQTTLHNIVDDVIYDDYDELVNRS